MALAKIIRETIPKVIKIDELEKKEKLREKPIEFKEPPLGPATNLSTNFSLLKTSITEKGIEIIPPEIFFKDIEPNQTYEIPVLIRNLSQKVRRIRVFQPQQIKFRCDYDMQGAIAPGLAMKLILSFETNAVAQYHDTMKIISEEDFEYEIPLHAYPPQAILLFEPFINLGFIKINQQKMDKIVFKNEGTVPGKVELKMERNEDLRLDPQFFTIAPNKLFSVKLFYRSREAGIFRGTIEVIVDGQSYQRDIHVNATCVEYNKFFIDDKGIKSETINFGKRYFGQPSSKEYFLVNNTPKPISFHSTFRRGFQKENDRGVVNTPAEVGLEMLEKVVSCEPSEGTIAAYSQVPITFQCKTKINDKHLVWSRNYSLSKDEAKEVLSENYEYSGLFEFDGEGEKPVIIRILAMGTCPTIKCSTNAFEFGECPVNERRDMVLTLENRNEFLDIDFSYEKLANFEVEPETSIIKAQDKFELITSFLPKSFGTFQAEMSLKLMVGEFKIPINLHGTCSSVAEKKIKIRGVESLPLDFVHEKTIIEEGKFEVRVKNKGRNKIVGESLTMTTESASNIIPYYDQSSLLQEHSTALEPKIVYQDYLKILRQEKQEKIKKKKIKEKMGQISEKLKDMSMYSEIQRSKEDSDLDSNQGEPPLDFDFVLGTGKRTLDSPRLPLPTWKDQLFVTKAIDRYEPQIVSISQIFNPNPDVISKKKLPSYPRFQEEARQCTTELSGEELQKIFVGPTILNMGKVFVKSKVVKSFQVKNDLRNSIMVRLDISQPELAGTYSKAQIIGSSQVGIFEVCFCSQEKRSFKFYLKYIINEIHKFEFIVTAEVVQVDLDIPNQQALKFTFDESNTSLVCKNKLKITNNGNDTAKFAWKLAENKVFSVNPALGEVPSMNSIEVEIIYKPSQGGKNEEEKLTMSILDGPEKFVKCVGYVSEARCSFKEPQLDMKEIPIFVTNEIIANLKNENRSSTAFRVLEETLPPGVQVTPSQGRLASNELKQLRVSVLSKEEKNVNSEIAIELRGGRLLKIPFLYNSVIPKVKIEEEDFDFGNIILQGNSGTLTMTLKNDSSIPGTLILDFRNKTNKENDGVECLKVQLIKEEAIAGKQPGPPGIALEDDEIMINIYEDEEQMEGEENSKERKSVLAPTRALMQKSLEDDDSDSNTSIEEEEEEEQAQYCKILIQGNKTLKFNLIFTPRDAKTYNFILPLSLQGFGKLESITRLVSCVCSHPVVLMEPQTIQFKRKVISTVGRLAHIENDFILNNPFGNKPVKWKIDPASLEPEKIFQFNSLEGVVKGGESMTIKAIFNPYMPGNFERKVPIYINGDFTAPFMDICLKGEASYPRILFDRSEIVLPVVPLGITSRAVFKILNDGYENFILKHTIPEDLGSLNLQIKYLDGKNIGVTRSKVRIEVVFRYKKPLSFTSKIEFMDETGNIYSLPVSGTTDNSIFTHYPSLQREPDEFRVSAEEGKPLRYREDLDDLNLETQKMNNSDHFSVARSHSAMTTMTKASSLLGYTPIPSVILEQECNFIVKWLNFLVFGNKIKSFPFDFIEGNGYYLFDLLGYLFGKLPVQKAVIDKTVKKNERVRRLYRQYDELIKFLKENGALLNTIRPQYLLKQNEYVAYIKINNIDTMFCRALKTNESRYFYVSMDSWITLFYQIMRIFYVGRITLKSFKITQVVPQEKLQVPDYIESSNIYNSSEYLLLRWLEVHFETLNPTQSKRLTCFDKDLKDCQFLASVVQTYVPGLKNVLSLKPFCQTEEDFKFNAERFLSACEEIGLFTCFTARDLLTGSQREIILYLVYLYQTLPQFIPRGPPIVFTCVLGDDITKNIELKNSSNKSITYLVKFEGHSDFIIEKSSVKLEGSEPIPFPIKLQSRIAAPVAGRITFIHKREGTISAPILVFDVISKITERRSIESWKTKAKLYQCEEVKVYVKNIFTSSPLEYAEFVVTLVHDKLPEKEGDKIKKKSQNKPPNRGGKPDQKDKVSAAVVPQYKPIISPFFATREKIRLKKGETQTLIVQYMPFSLEKHYCKLIFCDTQVGEFQHEIIGEALPPEPIMGIQPPFQIFVDTSHPHEVTIPFRNEQILNARKIHDNRLISLGRLKEREAFLKLRQKEHVPDMVEFEIELQQSGPYIHGPTSITLIDTSRKANKSGNPGNDQLSFVSGSSRDRDDVLNPAYSNKDKNNSYKEDGIDDGKLGTTNFSIGSTTKLPISYDFKAPIQNYNCIMTLRNADRSDIRSYRLLANALPKVVQATIEIRAPAGEEVKQDIPVINNSDRDWGVKASLTLEGYKNSSCFSGGKDFVVKKKSTGFYQLKFKPNWTEQAEAKLTLTIPHTNDTFEYELLGYGEEPLARDHFFLSGPAGKRLTKEIAIVNQTKKPMTLSVETDLINTDGIPLFTVAPGETYKYIFGIIPVLGGVYTGSVSFFEEDEKNLEKPDEQADTLSRSNANSVKKFFWYTICINAERPKAEKQIDLEAFIRKAVAFEITISNPMLQEAAIFEVLIEGERLMGDSTFLLEAGETRAYIMTFSPLREFKGKGSITFINERLGELWYIVNLSAVEQPPLRLPLLRAELGKLGIHEVFLENPSDKKVSIKVFNSNPQNFDVVPEQIDIPAMEEKLVKIRYSPSDLNTSESGEIVFRSDSIGKWHYIVYGQGLSPSLFDKVYVTCALGKEVSTQLLFRNPFKDSLEVNIYLNVDKSIADVFSLDLKKKRLVVEGLSSAQIPFNFFPVEMDEYSCEIVVFLNEKVKWTYPIIGITESVPEDNTFSYKMKSRGFLEKELQIMLPGLPRENLDQTFEFEFSNLPEEYHSMIQRCLTLKTIQNHLESHDQPLRYLLSFRPLKPFKLLFDFIITNRKGGRWKYRLNLEATEPDIDDVLIIKSAVNVTSSLMFKLTNRFKSFAPFFARFTPDSDPEFSVMPKSGDLEPIGRDGTSFIVTYTPVEYGKIKKGKLIIETPELFWSYLVKGTHPDFKSPHPVFSIDNKIDPMIERNLSIHSKEKNHMIENIKKIKMSYENKSEIFSKSSKKMISPLKEDDTKRKNKSSKYLGKIAEK